MRGPTFQLGAHLQMSRGPVGPSNSISAENPFNDQPINQGSGNLMHPANSTWPQQAGHQQWIGSQGPRQPMQSPGYPQPPNMGQPSPVMQRNQYSFPGNQGRMAPRFPQSPGSRSMYSPQSSSSPNSPGRSQISPIEGQISPGQGQMSPASYQGHMTPHSHSSPYSQPVSPEFLATPIHNNPPSSHQNVGRIHPSSSDIYPPSQVNQRLQTLLNSKRQTAHNPNKSIDPSRSEGFMVKRTMPSVMPNQQSSQMLNRVSDCNQPFGASQPLSVMTSSETSARDSFQSVSSASFQTSFPTPMTALSTELESKAPKGFLMRQLEALRNQKNTASANNSVLNNALAAQQRSQYARQTSAPAQSSSFALSGNFDSHDGGIPSRRFSANPLMPTSEISPPCVNTSLPFSLSPQAGNNRQLGQPSSSLGQHYSQHSLQECSTTPSSTVAEMCRLTEIPVPRNTAPLSLSTHYEQISPPVTPMVSPSSAKQPAQSTPSPSNNTNPAHLSPLQRLLLDPGPPTTPDNESGQRSRSRSSVSSTSSMTSAKSPGNRGTFSPPAATRKGFENSKLYNLLSGDAKKPSEPSSRRPSVEHSPSPLTVPQTSQASLNDSQQDIFAELSASNDKSDPSCNNADMDDSLLSLFSDDFKVKPITDPTPSVLQSDDGNNNMSLSQNPRSVQSMNSGTLSGLKNFVDSVRKGTEFGVDFNKQNQQIHERPAFMSQMSNSSIGSLDSSLGNSMPSTPQQNFQPSMVSPQHRDQSGIQSLGMQPHASGLSSLPGASGSQTMGPTSRQDFQIPQEQNLMIQQMAQSQQSQPGVNNWQQQVNTVTNKPMKKPRGEPGKRGRPRLNKSNSVPCAQLGDGVKKKRGRPRKNPEQPSSGQLISNYQGMPMQNTFQNQQNYGGMINQRRMSMPENMNANPPFMNTQRSFQELLEGDPVDFLAELNTDFDIGMPEASFGNSNQSMSNQMNTSQMNISFQSQSFSNSSQTFSNPHGRSVDTCSSMNDSLQSTFSNEGLAPTISQSMPYQQVPLQNTGQQFPQQHYQQQHHYHQNDHQQTQQPQPQQQCNQFMTTQSFTPQPNFNCFTGAGDNAQNRTNEASSDFNLSQAMNISEPTVNFDTGLDSLFQKEQSPDVADFGGSLTGMPSNPLQEQTGSNLGSRRERSLSMGERRRRLSSSKKSKSESNFVQHLTSTTDMSAVMELIQYRQKVMPKPSPAYTFKFQIPTPTFKKLKFIMKIKDIERNPGEIVRMHPKDARKYSLLKIGREVVKLICLTPEKIEEIKSRLTNGETVDTIPPAVRSVEVANIPITDSLIAELLAADSPSSDDAIKTSEVDNALMESFQNDTNEVPSVTSVENEEGRGKETENGEKVKRPRKNSLAKQGTMFKGNIASVPHLKKFRQGFPYFGKGRVGRGAHVKVRQSHPGLPQELEDDEDIVLKDVSLNDGVLTPIKSRTPVAGRSPAYCGGNMSEMEGEKDLLESKLEDLKYDLDLNQSGNSHTFQDTLFNEKELEKGEYIEQQQEQGSEENTVNSGETKTESREEEKCETYLNNETSELELKTEVIESKPEDLKLHDTEPPLQLKVEKEDNGSSAKGLNGKIMPASTFLPNDKLPTDRSRSRSSSLESPGRSSRTPSRANSLVGSGDEVAVDSANMLINVAKRRHSVETSNPGKRRRRTTSSNSSTAPGSRKGSRSSSCDNERKKKKSKNKNKKRPYRYDSDSDGIPGVDYIVTNKFKGQKELRVVVSKLDEDSLSKYSDTNNRVNGYKSDSYGEVYSDRASSAESEVRNTCESEGDVKKDSEKPFTGFSAEFEKFLSRSSAPPLSDSDTEDCDINEFVDKNKSDDSLIKDKAKECEFDPNNDAPVLEVVKPVGKVLLEDRDRSIKTENIDGTMNDFIEEASLPAAKELSTETARVQFETGECMSVDVCSSSCSCLRCCKNTNVNNSVSSFTGIKDFSSSSEDEEDQGDKKGLENFQIQQKSKSKSETKKRKAPNIKHDGRAFCTKRPRKRKPRARPTKLMNTLSVLHNATLEQLTNAQFNSDVDTSSSNQSPCKCQSASDVESSFRTRTKTPDFELYADRSDDHNTLYEDTMYKLAYLSPIHAENGNIAPPQPLSPQEMTKLDGTTDIVKEDTSAVNKEPRIPLPDVFKNVESMRDLDSGLERSNGAPSTPNKIAVAKTTTLTLQDIKSLCQAELENEAKRNLENEFATVSVAVAPSLEAVPLKPATSSPNPVPILDTAAMKTAPLLEAVTPYSNPGPPDSGSPPPDLGPPVCQSSLLQDKPDDYSRPPQLTPNRQISCNSDLGFEDELFSCTKKVTSPRNSTESSTPPVLLPCRSPKGLPLPKTQSSSPRCARIQDMVDKEDFMTVATDKNSKPGRSPGGSTITVVRSEEFSDISDDDESHGHGSRSKKQDTKQSMESVHAGKMGGASKKGGDIDRERKIKEVREFEERLAKSDRSSSNIFDLLTPSRENGIYPHTEAAVDYSLSRTPSHIPFLNKRPGMPTNFQFNGDKFLHGMQSPCMEKPSCLPSTERIAAHQPLNFAHTVDNFNVYKNRRNHKNGEYQRSLSQNDIKLDQKGYRNGVALNGFSPEHSTLNRSLPVPRRFSDTNGKYPDLGYRNFFDNFIAENESSGEFVRRQVLSNTGTSSDLFDPSSGTIHHANSRVQSFNRSLSESGRLDYSINHSSKVSENFVKNLKNCMNRDRISQNEMEKGLDMTEFGCGGGRNRKTNRMSQSQAQDLSFSSSQRGSGRPTDSGQSDSGHHGNNKGGQGHQPQVSYADGIYGCQVITPLNPPPSQESIQETAFQHGLPTVHHVSAFYGNHKDMPEKARYSDL